MVSSAVISACNRALEEEGLFGLLKTLNGTTAYRYTGIYRFEGRWVRSVWLYDREHPTLLAGSDVLWDDSYCRMTAEDGRACEIVDALHDPRLAHHAAREAVQSYISVLLTGPDGRALGTLCHYDVCAQHPTASTVATLEAIKPIVEPPLWNELGLTTHLGVEGAKSAT